MAVLKDDMVLRLLCHLAWLRDTGGSGSKQRTLAWARRVYNSATYLQFRFVYPHQSLDRVIESDGARLAEAIEAVVDAASDAIEPLRGGAGAVEEDSALDAATALALRDALTVLLDTATEVGWGGVHAPKEDVTLDRPVKPLLLLAKWRRRHGGDAASGSTASDEAMTELCKGVATKLVANHSWVMGRVPDLKSQVLHEVADAYLSVDVNVLGQAGGDQLIQRFVSQLLRTRTRRVR